MSQSKYMATAFGKKAHLYFLLARSTHRHCFVPINRDSRRQRGANRLGHYIFKQRVAWKRGGDSALARKTSSLHVSKYAELNTATTGTSPGCTESHHQPATSLAAISLIALSLRIITSLSQTLSIVFSDFPRFFQNFITIR